MNAYTDAIGLFYLPSGWHDVTTAEYLLIEGRPGITLEECAALFAQRPVPVNPILLDGLTFLLTSPPLEGPRPYPADLSQQTFKQVEDIRAALASQSIPDCFALVYATFSIRALRPHMDFYDEGWALTYAERCLSWPITDTFPAVAHCLAELKRLAAYFWELAEPDPTEAARRARAAGAESLDVFGMLNVTRHYAEVFATSIDVINQRPWLEIALFMLQDRKKAIVADTMEKQSANAPAND